MGKPTPHQSGRHARARRDGALKRQELRAETTPRTSAAGATSMAIKTEDPAIRRMIDEALSKRQKPPKGDG